MTKLTILLGCLIALFAGQLHAQKAANGEKTRLVADLVKRTFPMFSMDELQAKLAEDSRKTVVGVEKSIETELLKDIDEGTANTKEQRAEARARMPEFAKRLAARLEKVAFGGFDPSKWMRDWLSHNFSTKFTLSELRSLDRFFRSKAGLDFLQTTRKNVLNQDQGKPDTEFSDRSAIVIDRFYKTPAGKKFNASLDDMSYFNKQADKWLSNMKSSMEHELKSGEIAKMMEEFIAAIIKK